MTKRDEQNRNLVALLRDREEVFLLDADGPTGVKVARRDPESPKGYRIMDVVVLDEAYDLTQATVGVSRQRASSGRSDR